MQVFKLFWILLFLIGSVMPLSYMNTAKISKQENRTLAQFPKIVQEGKLNKNYGADFENWLSDRFWGRNTLMHLHLKAQFINKVVRNTQALYFKKDGWMFKTIPYFSDSLKEKISEIVKQIKNFDKFCRDQGIKLYILFVPGKETIYTDSFDEYLYEPQKVIDSYVDAFTEIKNQLGPMFVFPYDELKEGSKKDFVFFKESHHWTDYGAFLGYMKLMDSIKRDFKNVKIVSLNNYKKTLNKKIRDDWGRKFNTGSILRLLNIPSDYAKKHILKTNYTYYDPLVKIKPQVLSIPKYKIKNFKNKGVKTRYKVFLSGFSHNENLLQFLPYSFAETKYYRLNGVKNVAREDDASFLKRYKKDLLDYKPDILILTITDYRFFQKELWNTED